MPIPIRCTGCSRTINAPDHAAGKRVKCPACATVLSVPAGTAAAASGGRTNPAARTAQAAPQTPARPAPARPAPAPAASAPLYSPFEPIAPVDHDALLTDSDFNSFNPAAPRRPTGPEIPQAKKKQKRPASFYKVPGIFGIVAAGLNIAAASVLVVLLIVLIVGVAMSGEKGIALILGLLSLRLFLFAGFTIGGNIHAIVACLNLIHMTSRGASLLSIGEFIFNPIAFGLLVMFNWGGFKDGWVAGLVAMGIFALWNWPCAIWIALAVSGEQAKIDFEEIDNDELEELAAELQRRAAMKEGGH